MNLKLVAVLRVVAKAATKTLYRGVQDIYPSQVNHNYIGEGVFGNGTYFARDYDTAEDYAKGGIYSTDDYELFGLVMEYKATFTNLLMVSEDHLEGLESGEHTNYLKMSEEGLEVFEYEQPISFPATELTRRMADDGWDGIFLIADNSGVPDGGEQLIIPPGSKVKPVLQKVTFIFESERAEEFAKKMKLKPIDEWSVEVSKAKLKQAEKALRAMF